MATAELSAVEVAQLEGQAFFDSLGRLLATQRWDAPIDNGWGLLERCDRELRALAPLEVGPTKHFDKQWACSRVGADVIADATREDLQQLSDSVAAQPPDTVFMKRLAEAALDRALVLAARSLTPAASAAPVPADAPLPADAMKLPEELRSAWRQVTALQKLRLDSRHALSARHSVSVQGRFPEFYGAVWDLLAGRATATEAEQTIGSYVWGGFCGTGMEALSAPQDKALLLAWLEQGRLDVAAAAVLAMQPTLDLGSRDATVPAEVFVSVLAAAGLDWEALAAATFAAVPYQRGTVLGTHGSNRGARLLLAVADIRGAGGGTPGVQPNYLHQLATFVAPNEECNLGTFDVALKRSIPSGISAETETRILSVLAAHANASAREEAQMAARLLRLLCKRESLPAFQAMLNSRYAAVEQAGRDGLKAHGLMAPSAKRPAKVSFQLMDGDKPLVSTAVLYDVKWPNGGFTHASAKTDASGVVGIDRDLFVDTKNRLQRIEFWQAAEGGLTQIPRLRGGTPPPDDLAIVTTVRLSAPPKP